MNEQVKQEVERLIDEYKLNCSVDEFADKVDLSVREQLLIPLCDTSRLIRLATTRCTGNVINLTLVGFG